MTEKFTPAKDTPTDETALESWKEIAAYLKRDVSTLKRWEKSEDLPVHRHLHQTRSSVYAYRSELDDWWARRRPAEEASMLRTWMRSRPVRALAFTVMLLLALATAGDGLVLGPFTSAARGQGTSNRLVWGGSLVDALGAPSPDGSYIAVTEWNTGNLALRDTSTGAMRLLTENENPNWKGFAEFGVPSPDGKQIAYSWFNERAQFDVRVYSLETSSAHVVYAHDEIEYAQPCAWTPDGKHILATLARTDRVNQIAFIDLEDGSARVLKTMDWRSPGKVVLSPDGRYIAYDFPPEEDSPERDIFVLAADGSHEELLVEHPDNDEVLAWMPDGKNVLFGSDRTGRMGIWVLPMVDGKALGAPELVRPDVPVRWGMGVTREGAFYYGVYTGMTDVFVARLDAGTGAVLSPPAPLSTRYVGWNRSPSWSADGKFVAYVSQREPRRRSVGWMGGAIVIRSLASGEEREITPQLETMGRRIRWSPDGRSFLARGRDAKGRSGFFALSAETGEATLVLREEPPGYDQLPEWTPDSKSLLYYRTTPEASNTLRLRNLETGEDREVLDQFTSNYAISPDGQSLVVRVGGPGDKASGLAIVPTSGGEAKELLRVRQPNVVPSWSGLAWTPDGKHILFTQTTGESRQQPFELWRIPVEGGTPQKTGIAMEELRDLGVHPDGQQIVFGAGEHKHEVWVMEHFLPALNAAK